MVMRSKRGGGEGGRGEKLSWRRYWRMAAGLALCCSGFYLLLYYRVSLTVSSHRLFFRVSGDLGGGCGEGGVEDDVPLLTLFSTWVNREDLKLVRNLTLRNRAQMRPLVLPLLFSNDSDMVEEALQSGWETLPVSRTVFDVPVLKNMYLDAMCRFKSTLYAYANGDILFTDALLGSLKAILGDPALQLDQHSLLVIGQRTNVQKVTDEEALNFGNISQVARARGELFSTWGIDFFITDRTFPWDSVPELVVGRIGYDNWLVQNAIQNRTVVVDITKTSLAVHQTTGKGNREGRTHNNSNYNTELLRGMFRRVYYKKGITVCAPWHTRFDSAGKVVVKKKVKRERYC